MGSCQSDRDGEDTLVEALGRSHTQYELPPQGSMGEHPPSDQGREDPPIRPKYDSDQDVRPCFLGAEVHIVYDFRQVP